MVWLYDVVIWCGNMMWWYGVVIHNFTVCKLYNMYNIPKINVNKNKNIFLLIVKLYVYIEVLFLLLQVMPILESEAFSSCKNLNESVRSLPVSATDQRFLEQAARVHLRKTTSSALHRNGTVHHWCYSLQLVFLTLIPTASSCEYLIDLALGVRGLYKVH